MLNALFQTFRTILHALADVIMPRECIVCNTTLYLHEKHLCIKCLADLPLTYFWTCSHNEMADKLNDKLQGITDKYEYACALYFYRQHSGYDRISQEMKYFGDIEIGKTFSSLLGEKLSLSQLYANVDAVIPIPLHPFRKWKRGFNQAEIIASEIAKKIGADMRNDIIKRSKPTKTQTKLSVKEKSENVKNAFRLDNNSIQNYKHILLVDDVFTTGSTMASCFKTLKQACHKNTRISVAVLGYVD